jgi:hypothetical protein
MLASPIVGFTTSGDTTTNGLTYGFSTAYVEDGWGAEFDLSHSREFNDEGYSSTGLTTFMFNVMAAPRVHRWVWPYLVAGAGIMRARGCIGLDCVRTFSRTELGLDAGGGTMIPLHEWFGARFDVRYFRFARIHRDLPRVDSGPFDVWRITWGGYFHW